MRGISSLDPSYDMHKLLTSVLCRAEMSILKIFTQTSVVKWPHIHTCEIKFTGWFSMHMRYKSTSY